jgi:pimeloyl-ACP methyl ester carboxylesterase
LATLPVSAAVSERRIEDLFRPFLGDQITLSPDGKQVAYSQHSGQDLNVVLQTLDGMPRKLTINVDEDRVIANSKERERAALSFLRWATPTRLVFAPTVQTLTPVGAVRPTTQALGSFDVSAGSNLQSLSTTDPETAGMTRTAGLLPVVIAPIMAVDADGRNGTTLAQAKDFATIEGGGDGSGPVNVLTPAPEILGFAPGDFDHLLVLVPGFGGQEPVPARVHRLNVHTGKITLVSSEFTSRRLLYDRQGQPRLLTEGGVGRRLALTYRYRTPDGGKWSSLADLAPEGSPAATFAVEPATFFGERARPLGFAYEPNLLLYTANLGRDTNGIYLLDTTTLQPGRFRLEHPTRDLAPLAREADDRPLLFDERKQQFVGVRTVDAPELTVWLDPAIGALQRTLNAQFPDRTVTILEWDEARTRFLIRVTGGASPGRFFVLKTAEKNLLEISRVAPWLDDASLHETRYTEFPGPGGTTLSGYLTLPRKPRTTPIPLVVEFAGGLPATPHAEFDREAQVLGDLGLAVLRLNQRGVSGRGRAQREALAAGIDQAAVEDASAAIEWAAGQFDLDRRRVVAAGVGFGGYLAVRATQLAPDRFRVAFVTSPVLEPALWTKQTDVEAEGPTFQQEANRLYIVRTAPRIEELSATTAQDGPGRAIFVVYRGARSDLIPQGVGRLRSQLRSRGIPHETIDVNEDYFLGLPKARARVYKALDEFLNLNLYQFDVKVGPTEVVR